MTTAASRRPTGTKRSVYENTSEHRKHRRWVAVLKVGCRVTIERRETESEARKAIGMRPARKR